MRIEHVIFSNLIQNEEYARQVIPHLRKDYFHDYTDEKIYVLIDNYIEKYNSLPSKEALKIDLSNLGGLDDDQYKGAELLIDNLSSITKQEIDWLVDETEKFCKDKAVYNALRASIGIIDDDDSVLNRGAIPALLTEALSISFNSSIGHSYTEDADERYEFYHRKEERIPFDLDYLNRITKGGLPKKTLTILLGGIGAGKSLCMCHMAAANLMMGYNVLYITMELAEERVAERIDANLMNVTLDELYELPRDVYKKKIDRIKEKTAGNLVVKEYPTSGAGSGNFRHLLNELRLKKNFKPDIIYIDYINICTSSRLKNSGNVGSYTYIKAIAEEIRGLAVEFNLPIVSATQVNREGLNSSDLDLTNTSESIGLPASADIMLAIIATDEMLELNQYMIKQLKNRFSDIGRMTFFVIGVDKSKMRLYNTEQSSQIDKENEIHKQNNSTVDDLKSKFSQFK